MQTYRRRTRPILIYMCKVVAPAAFSLLFVTSLVLAQAGGVVTETMRIEIDKKMHTARKINGRWWSEDNRELTQTNVGWLWNVSGGNAWQLVRFDHHRPVDPTRVAQLDRTMGPDQVKTILGPPNSVFPSDRPASQQQWDYYGAGGYKLSIHFSSSGGIFTASYQPDAKAKPMDVPHLVFRVNGKSAQEAYEERKNQPQREIPASQEEFRRQLQEEMAKRRAQTGTSPAR